MVIEQIFDAARLAPSWKNMHCWRFLVLIDAEKQGRVSEAFPDDNPGKKSIATAPVLIVVCGNPAESEVENGIDCFVADVAIAFEHLCLAAHGLGTCWMGWYNEKQSKHRLGILEEIRIVGITPLGYPEQEPKRGLANSCQTLHIIINGPDCFYSSFGCENMSEVVFVFNGMRVSFGSMGGVRSDVTAPYCNLFNL